MIGLVLLRGLTNPYFARLADAVEREVRRRGMRLQMAVSSDDDTADPADRARREADLIAQMRADAVEGLLLGPVYEDLDLREHAALIDGRLPTVLLAGGAADAPPDVVGDDAAAGWRLAAEHLRDLGHRRVGFLCAPPSRVDPPRSGSPGTPTPATWPGTPRPATPSPSSGSTPIPRRGRRPSCA